MTKRITLTQYHSGLLMEIDPDVITVIQPLAASHDMTGSEHGLRTRIDYVGEGVVLMRESLDEINAAIAELNTEQIAKAINQIEKSNAHRNTTDKPSTKK